MVLLRKYPRLAKMPLCLDIYQKKLPQSTLHSVSPARKYALKKISPHTDTTCCPHSLLTRYTKQSLLVRTYSSSSRNSFKAEAPIGIVEESSLNPSSFGGRLGQSFNQLSRHVNIYFGKKRDIAPFEDDTCQAVTNPIYLSRAQQRRTKTSSSRDEEERETSATAPTTQEMCRPQLFHISAMATTFGQSYSYVSHHINSVFFSGSAAVQRPGGSEMTAKPGKSQRRHKKRKVQSTYIMNCTDDAGASAKPTDNDPHSSSWEDGFRHFARHVNNYFGAKVKDEACKNDEGFRAQSTSVSQCVVSKQEAQAGPGTPSLFHTSQNTTSFGANHIRMASHINQYFKGHSDLDEDQEGDPLPETVPRVSTPPKTASFMDYLRHPTSAIHDLLGSHSKRSHIAGAQPTTMSRRSTLNPKVS